MQKLVSFCMFVFVVPKFIAHEIAITCNFVSQKTFINLRNFQPTSNQTKKLGKLQRMENCSILSPKTLKTNILTLN